MRDQKKTRKVAASVRDLPVKGKKTKSVKGGKQQPAAGGDAGGNVASKWNIAHGSGG